MKNIVTVPLEDEILVLGSEHAMVTCGHEWWKKHHSFSLWFLHLNELDEIEDIVASLSGKGEEGDGSI